jgi:Ras-related GTP-binding protein A/B
VHTLIPNAAILSKHLSTFAAACSATEVILFERTTFLVIATSSPSSSNYFPEGEEDTTHLEPKRYERTSELIKAFKQSCSRVREEFRSLEMELYDFTAVLDEMTRNTYVLVIVHDPTIGVCFSDFFFSITNTRAYIETAALKLNIRLARRKFEDLQSDSLIS